MIMQTLTRAEIAGVLSLQRSNRATHRNTNKYDVERENYAGKVTKTSISFPIICFLSSGKLARLNAGQRKETEGRNPDELTKQIAHPGTKALKPPDACPVQALF
jgi:hypothetical protein